MSAFTVRNHMSHRSNDLNSGAITHILSIRPLRTPVTNRTRSTHGHNSVACKRNRNAASLSRGGRVVCSADRDKEIDTEAGSLRQAAQTYMEAVIKHVAASSKGDDEGAAEGGRLDPSACAALEQGVQIMQRGLVERDTEVRLLLLAALCGEHVLYLGPPGTAKSELGRRLSQLTSGSYFERLLTRFSVPEELFGPLSMRALEEDKYIRKIRGYLPSADVAFIDEIFKANSAILNTLLTILNERLFDNGSSRSEVPLICMVAASNELPESEELDALYDRFLIRREVKQVSPGGLAQLLSETSSADRSGGSSDLPTEMPLTLEEFQKIRSDAVKAVEVPQSVIQLITDLRVYLQEKVEPPCYVSDRRLVKSIALLQVAAYTNGRLKVSEVDCLLLQHVLWNRPDLADRIYDWILGQLAIDDGIKQVQYLLSGMFGRACRASGKEEEAKKVQAELGKLREVLCGKLAEINGSLEGNFPLVRDHCWLGTEDAEAVAAALGPKLEKTKASVESLLYEVVTLEVAIEAGSEPVVMAELMPRHWAEFIRSGPIEEQVKPLGLA
uniref:MoxR-like ATPase n=1 Tax=Tetraselmis sp. GSL018 TaxID=582737 RepID=A0A061S138_9CHLO